ncbi:MAG: TonB family protein [Bacteroidales bacterium]|jgi:protein TonB|nr:TonB family protein [Bacteroidales bacterium]
MLRSINLNSKEWRDLVFESRNKIYGAYELRKNSNKRHLHALLIVLALVAMAVSLPLLLQKKLSPDAIVEDNVRVLTIYEPDSPKDPAPVVRQPEVQPPVAASIQFSVMKMTDRNKMDVSTELPPTNDEVFQSTAVVDIVTNEKGVPDGILPSEAVKDPIPMPPTETDPLPFTDQMPVFPGGQQEMMNFLNQHLRYPQVAIDEHIQGKVVVQFVVNTKGEISRVKILAPLHPTCDKEAIRLIKSMPNWIPGRKNGELVSVYFTIPIRFLLAQ